MVASAASEIGEIRWQRVKCAVTGRRKSLSNRRNCRLPWPVRWRRQYRSPPHPESPQGRNNGQPITQTAVCPSFASSTHACRGISGSATATPRTLPAPERIAQVVDDLHARVINPALVASARREDFARFPRPRGVLLRRDISVTPADHGDGSERSTGSCCITAAIDGTGHVRIYRRYTPAFSFRPFASVCVFDRTGRAPPQSVRAASGPTVPKEEPIMHQPDKPCTAAKMVRSTPFESIARAKRPPRLLTPSTPQDGRS